MTFVALDALFRGPLEPYRERVVPHDDPRPSLAGTALIERHILNEHLTRFARTFPDPEPRAVASIWSKHHFAALIPPTLAAYIVLGRILPTALDVVGVVTGEDGRTAAFKLRDTGARSDSSALPFAALLEGHLTPLVTALADVSGLAPRVLWSNAGNVFDFVVRQAGMEPLVDRAGLAAAERLLASRRLPSGDPNPLFEPVRIVTEGEQQRRRRRVCCLRYLHPTQSLCATCPLPRRPSDRRGPSA
jgi:ferric iron reductase protein FhuF